jgi:hypothetical protein
VRIAILPSTDGDAIAWEEQFGQREGRFVVTADGSVVYRHPWHQREWFAGTSESQFRAWNAYNEAVVEVPDSEKQAVVESLRKELDRIGALPGRPDSFWGVLLEQAEAGML